jgi:hypothetical protein
LVNTKGTVVRAMPSPFGIGAHVEPDLVAGIGIVRIGRGTLRGRGRIKMILVVRPGIFPGNTAGIGVGVSGVAPVAQQPSDRQRRDRLGTVPAAGWLHAGQDPRAKGHQGGVVGDGLGDRVGQDERASADQGHRNRVPVAGQRGPSRLRPLLGADHQGESQHSSRDGNSEPATHPTDSHRPFTDTDA